MKTIKKYSQYIKGTFTEVEMEDITKEIVKDHFEKEELVEKWNQILQEKKVYKSKELFSLGNSKRFIKIGLTTAATISLLLFVWFMYQTPSLSPYEKLLSEELNNPYIETLSRKGDIEELRLQAIASYNSREYATAIRYFEQLSKIDQTVDWIFYIGLCQLYQKQTDLAIESFTVTLKHSNKKYIIETNWYLGLAHTMNKDFKSAKKHLGIVADPSRDEMAWKVKEARAMLNALAEKE